MKVKKYKKKSSYNKQMIKIVYLMMISLSVYFFFKTYQYISNVPEANNITQEEIYDLTRIEESDIKLVRALKNDAFDSWLYEANDDKVKKLEETQEIITSITEGKVKVSAIDSTIGDLKKDVDTISDSDIEELYVLYYKKVLPKQYEKADKSFKEMTVDQPETKYEEIFKLLDLLNKIYNQKGMQSVTNDPNFKQSVSLIEEINSNFKEVNQIKSAYVNFDSLKEPMATPTTRFGMELESYVFELNHYIESKRLVTEFENRYSELQRNLSTNKEIIKNSAETPDLVGMTIEEAQKELNKAKLNLGIRGYTNKNYKNGDRVQESQREIENWDNDKQDKIMRQEPSPINYEFIAYGSTIQVIVENKPIKKPEESTESSSSSIFESSTSSSSSTEETTSTETSSDVND